MNFMGRKVKDKITGFTGIVTGYVSYISGCNQVLITPSVDKDGKIKESEWVDEQRVKILPGKTIALNNSQGAGFGPPAPKR